jgi:hypothetical protein
VRSRDDPPIAVRPRRFELLTSGFVGQRSIQLSYGRVAAGPVRRPWSASQGNSRSAQWVTQGKRSGPKPIGTAPTPRHRVGAEGAQSGRRGWGPDAEAPGRVNEKTRGYRPPAPRVGRDAISPFVNRRSASSQAPRPRAVPSEAARRKEEEMRSQAEKKVEESRPPLGRAQWAAAHSPRGLPFCKHTMCPAPFRQDFDAFSDSPCWRPRLGADGVGRCCRGTHQNMKSFRGCPAGFLDPWPIGMSMDRRDFSTDPARHASQRTPTGD